jgi:tryptophan 7-halogenase
MPIDRIVIAGGGVAGWMTASALARATPCTVTVVDAGGQDISLGYPSHAEPTLPSIVAFFDNSGMNEDQFLRTAHGSFTLGRALSGWGGAGQPGFHPYGDMGASIGPVAFHQLATHLRGKGETVNLANYTIAALCAQTGRFSRPPADARSVLSTMDYGIHVELRGLVAALRSDALACGAVAQDGEVLGAEMTDTGLIEAVVTTDNHRIKGDLFIDCTGAPGALIAGMLGVRYESWAHWLPCDRIASTLHPTAQTPAPFTHVDAQRGGWQRFVALQDFECETRCYQSAYSDDDPAATPLASGRRAAPWVANCIAIGGAAAVVDPLASTSLHLIQSAISRLIRLFPHDRTAPIEAIEYNQHSVQEIECARDFAIAHYKLNGRRGEPFWDACRAMAVPDRLGHKIALYQSCGRTALHDGEVFEDNDWIALFDALGVRPHRCDALVNGIAGDAIDAHFTRLRDVMLKAVASVPPHSDYIRQHVRHSA